jgi:NAD(P)-dependent dehydrogenase (short-subunit alcohol dehydrogenase family)
VPRPRTVGQAVDRVGGIHILINNAGIDDETPFLDVDRIAWPDHAEIGS